jgi:hypothetical protein
VDVVLEFEDAFDIEIDDDDVDRVETVQKLHCLRACTKSWCCSAKFRAWCRPW